MCEENAIQTDVLPDEYLNTVINLMAEDGARFSYRPGVAKLTGYILAAILLERVIYWWHKMGQKPFYKFRAPCKHVWYRTGDSWVEELGFTVSEYDSARTRITTKISGEAELAEALKTHYKPGTKDLDPARLVIYWTHNNVTWWVLNAALLGRFIKLTYGSRKAESEKPNPGTKAESGKPDRRIGKGDSRNRKSLTLSTKHYSLRNRLTQAKAAKNGDGSSQSPAAPITGTQAAAEIPIEAKAIFDQWALKVPDVRIILAAYLKAKKKPNVRDIAAYADGIIRGWETETNGWKQWEKVIQLPSSPNSAAPPSPQPVPDDDPWGIDMSTFDPKIAAENIRRMREEARARYATAG